MTIKKDLTGQTFTRLTVLGPNGVRKTKGDNARTHWLCRCICGKEVSIAQNCLVTGNTKSCGCAQRDAASAYYMKHGKATRKGKEKIYMVYRSMMRRCYAEKSADYRLYGARGVTVSSEWHDFSQFYADMGDAPKGKSLDRIDNDAPYSKKNCRWATNIEQANNRRTDRFIEYNGVRKTMMQWSRDTGINHQTIATRLKSGCPMERLFDPPRRPRRFTANIEGVEQ